MTVGDIIEKYWIYVLIGLLLNFLITRPVRVYKVRKWCKSKGHQLQKLKWYEWFL